MYPKTFETLVECFQKLPGVGLKTAERYAFHVIEWKDEDIHKFIDGLSNIETGIHQCKICGNLSENELCEVCTDLSRNKQMICVVQSPKDVIAMEKTKEYNGLYHVLNGVISTSKGILPEDININTLLDRTTALYLSKLLEQYDVNVTRIAHGLPMGGHLDYADELTLIKAIEGRKKM